MQHNAVKKLTLIPCALLMISAIDSIRNLPATALFGSSLIFYMLLAAVVFLIPCALISAELANNKAGRGGVYQWVTDAFGEKIGFVAIWLQWINTMIWYPTILSFLAGTLAYLINPALAENKYYLISVILVIFWGLTFINIKGLHASAKFAGICTVIGMIIPMILIIAAGIIWFIQGNPLQISFSVKSILPSFGHSQSWISLTAILASFLGMELTSVHAKDMEHSQKNFPKALLIAVIVILSTMMLGSLTIAAIMPNNQIGLVEGVMQVFMKFLQVYHLTALFPILGVMILIGSLGGMVNWIISPAKGLLHAGQDGFLPKQLLLCNNKNVPVKIMLAQACLVSLVCVCFLFMPSVNGSYWFLTDLSTQLYMLMYILLFASGLVLKKSSTAVNGFVIPGGKFGTGVVTVVGILGCIMSIIIGFFPPDNINVGGFWHYEAMFAGGLIFMSIPALFGIYYKKMQTKHKVAII
ncbi:MAG: amino acid permease [Legionellales bacterium]|nr:amino acid permease [Legionellales bacterium]|tara:strand:+ start:555 stop:1961 length:1407 start_codon:yes stop_codon:yes gene_type:complete